MPTDILSDAYQWANSSAVYASAEDLMSSIDFIYVINADVIVCVLRWILARWWQYSWLVIDR